MDQLEGRTAVITGGGGFLGTGMARVLAREGMNVAVADLNQAAAEATAAEVEKIGAKALAVRTDVTDPSSMEALADQVYQVFGELNLLCLNAGAGILKPFAELTRQDWDHVLSVQWGGVLNGILTFLPRLLSQGGQRHIVITSSMSGVGLADLRQLNAPYVTAKFAVVGMTEVMAPSLAEHGIGVSVLCPGYTVPDPSNVRFAMPSAAWYEHNLLTAEPVGEEVVHAVREGRLYIFPHRAGRAEVEERHRRLMQGFDQAQRTSPPIG